MHELSKLLHALTWKHVTPPATLYTFPFIISTKGAPSLLQKFSQQSKSKPCNVDQKGIWSPKTSIVVVTPDLVEFVSKKSTPTPLKINEAKLLFNVLYTFIFYRQNHCTSTTKEKREKLSNHTYKKPAENTEEKYKLSHLNSKGLIEVSTRSSDRQTTALTKSHQRAQKKKYKLFTPKLKRTDRNVNFVKGQTNNCTYNKLRKCSKKKKNVNKIYPNNNVTNLLLKKKCWNLHSFVTIQNSNLLCFGFVFQTKFLLLIVSSNQVVSDTRSVARRKFTATFQTLVQCFPVLTSDMFIHVPFLSGAVRTIRINAHQRRPCVPLDVPCQIWLYIELRWTEMTFEKETQQNLLLCLHSNSQKILSICTQFSAKIYTNKSGYKWIKFRRKREILQKPSPQESYVHDAAEILLFHDRTASNLLQSHSPYFWTSLSISAQFSSPNSNVI